MYLYVADDESINLINRGETYDDVDYKDNLLAVSTSLSNKIGIDKQI